jgi:hypothetical protein
MATHTDDEGYHNYWVETLGSNEVIHQKAGTIEASLVARVEVAAVTNNITTLAPALVYIILVTLKKKSYHRGANRVSGVFPHWTNSTLFRSSSAHVNLSLVSELEANRT